MTSRNFPDDFLYLFPQINSMAKGFAGLIILFSLFLISCQKEVDGKLEQINGNDSIYIERYIEFDTTQPAGSDTTLDVHYTYDSQKRIRNRLVYVHDPNIILTSSMNFHYQGTDTLPFKTTEFINDGGHPYE